MSQSDEDKWPILFRLARLFEEQGEDALVRYLKTMDPEEQEVMNKEVHSLGQHMFKMLHLQSMIERSRPPKGAEINN